MPGANTQGDTLEEARENLREAVMLVLEAVGFVRYLTGTIQPIHTENPLAFGGGAIGMFVILTAFSNGCTAMTGVEAVSNGVMAFE